MPSVGEVSIELSLDRSRFDRDLRSLSGLKPLDIDVKLNTQSLSRQLGGVKRDAIAIDIAANTNVLERQLKNLPKLQDCIKIDLCPDIEGFKRKLEQVYQIDIDCIRVELCLDETTFKRKLQKLRSEVDSTLELNINQNLDVAVNATNLEKEFAASVKRLESGLKNSVDGLGDTLGQALEDGLKKVKPKSGGIVGILTAPLRSVVTGFYEGIGLTYSQKLASGFIKNLEKELGVSLQKVGQNVGSYFTDIGKRAGDSLLKKAGLEAGLEDLKPALLEIKQFFDDLIDVDLINQKISVIEKRLIKLFDSLTTFQPLETNLRNFSQAASSVGDIATVPLKGLERRKRRTVRETAESIRQSYDPNQEPQTAIPEAAKFITLASGGFAGAGGQSGQMVAKKLQLLLGEEHKVIPAQNPNTDTTASIQELGPTRWLAEAGLIIGKHIIKGINPDAIPLARQAYELYKQNPDKQLRIAGFSAGGLVAQDAVEILKAAGVPAKGVAIGSPIVDYNSSLTNREFKSVLRAQDPVTGITNKVAFPVGGLSKDKTIITPGENHDLALYLGEKQAQEAILSQLFGTPQKAKPELLNPDVFRLVGHKEDAENALAGLQGLLESPATDPRLNRKLLSISFQGLKQVRENLEKTLPTLTEDTIAEVKEYIAALSEAEEFVKDILSSSKKDKAAAFKQELASIKIQPIEAPSLAAPTKDDLQQEYTAEGLRKVVQSLGYSSSTYTKPKADLIKLISEADQQKVAKTISQLGDDIKKQQYKTGAANTRARVDEESVKKAVAENTNAIASALKHLDEVHLEQRKEFAQTVKTRIAEQINAIDKLTSGYNLSGETAKALGGYRTNLEQNLLTKAIDAAIKAPSDDVESVKKLNPFQGRKPLSLASLVGKFRTVFTKNANEPILQAEQVYEALIKEIAKVSKFKIKPGDIPKLKIDDDRLKRENAKALYLIKENTILLSSELARALEGTASEIKRRAKELNTIVHEGRHALQFDFGRTLLKNIAYGTKQPGIDLISPLNASRSARFNAARSIDPTKTKAVQKAIFATEVDAYAFEEVFSPQIVKNALAGAGKPSRRSLDFNLPSVEAVNDFVKDVKKLRNASKTVAEGASNFFGFLDQLPGKIKQVNPLLGDLVERGLNLAKAFVGFSAGAIVFSILRSLVGEGIKTALQFESLTVAMKTTAGSAIATAKNIAFVTEETKRLRVPLLPAIEGFSKFSAAARGTPLESQAKSIFSATTQAISVMGLGAEEAQGIFLALSQMAGKGKVAAEEFRGQLGERLPMATAVAARSLGVTTEQFTKMLDSGQILAQDFLPRFAAQLASETQGGVAGAANTGQAALNRFDNAMMQLKLNVGNTALPVEKLGLNILSGLLEGATKNSQIFVSAIGALAVAVLQALIPVVAKLIPTRLLLVGVGAAIDGLLAALPKLALQFTAVYAAMELYRGANEVAFGNDLAKDFQNLENSAKDAAKAIREVREEAGKRKEQPTEPTEPTSSGGLLGVYDFLTSNAEKGLDFLANNGKHAELFNFARYNRDRVVESLGNFGLQAQQTVGEVNNTIGSGGNGQLDLLPGLDDQILRTSQRRSILQARIEREFTNLGKALTPELKNQLAALNTEFEKLSKQRIDVAQPFSAARNKIQQTIDEAKSKLEYLNSPQARLDLAGSPILLQDLQKNLQTQIQDLTKSKDALDNFLASAKVNPILALSEAFRKLNIELGKNAEATEKAFLNRKLAIAQDLAKNIAKDPLATQKAELNKAIAERANFRKTAENLQLTITRGLNQFAGSSQQNELERLGVNINSSAAQVQAVLDAPNADKLSDADKFILNQLKSIREAENQLKQTLISAAEADVNVIRQTAKIRLEMLETANRTAERVITTTAQAQSATLKLAQMRSPNSETSNRLFEQLAGENRVDELTQRIGLARDRIAQLNRTGYETQREYDEERLRRESDLASLQSQRMDEQLAGERRIQDEVITNLHRRNELETQSLERSKQLLLSRRDLSKALSDASIAASESQLAAFDQALEIRRKMDETTDPNAKNQLSKLLGRLGTGGSELNILKQKQEIEDNIQQQRLDALQQEQALARQLLEIDLKRQKLAAQIAADEAEIANQRALIAVIQASKDVADAKKSGDSDNIIQAEKILGIQRQILDVTAKQVQNAKDNLAVQDEVASNAIASLNAQQQAALNSSDAANDLRDVQQEAAVFELKNKANATTVSTDRSAAAQDTNETLPEQRKKPLGFFEQALSRMSQALGTVTKSYRDPDQSGSIGLNPKTSAEFGLKRSLGLDPFESAEDFQNRMLGIKQRESVEAYLNRSRSAYLGADSTGSFEDLNLKYKPSAQSLTELQQQYKPVAQSFEELNQKYPAMTNGFTDFTNGLKDANKGIEQKLDILNQTMAQAIASPRSLYVSSPTPVTDAASVYSDIARQSILNAGLG